MHCECRSTSINGVYELSCPPFRDHRGTFLNAYRGNQAAFLSSWQERQIAQVNISRSDIPGTIRGLHLQSPPHAEAKLVRCLRGRVWDVAVDLRPESPTYREWHAVDLTPMKSNSLLIPEGCAHGFQVLEPESELLYIHSGDWASETEFGVRFDDPQLAIHWPLPPQQISERDLALPLLKS
jgi:dTDP-4-dehydrorhamnose 3,5-epimerase